MTNVPDITVITSTWRLGGFSPLLPALAAQEGVDLSQVEVVIADSLWSYRWKTISNELTRRAYPFKVIHCPVDNGLWPKACDPAHGYNSALRRSNGRLLVWMAADYACPPPGYLKAHWDLFLAEGGKVIGRSPYVPYTVPVEQWHPALGKLPIHPDEMATLAQQSSILHWSTFETGKDVSNPEHVQAAPGAPRMSDPIVSGPIAIGSRITDRWMHHWKSESCARSAMLDINGWDEDYDRQYGQLDIDTAQRLFAYGLTTVVIEPTMVLLDAHPISNRPRESPLEAQDNGKLLAASQGRCNEGRYRCVNGLEKS